PWIVIKLFAYREHRSSRSALFDDLEEGGGLRASPSYSNGMEDHDNEKTMDSLHDRVSFLKRVSSISRVHLPVFSSIESDINEEVESHNRMLDRMGNEMDSSRGIMSGTMDRFKMVFEKKSNQRICKLAAYFVVAFFVLYYTFR
ncbi:hypothetical protein RD792_017466, partial [Penstemon davidsonii]